MRNPWKITAATLLVALVALTASACGDDTSDNEAASKDTTTTSAMESTTSTAATASAGTIVDVASSNPDFSTLVTAVKAAGLDTTLTGEGPFTVFAPTNEAFAKVPKDQLDAILADKAKLSSILTYHVVPSKVLSTDLQPTQSVKTVQGGNVDIKVDGSSATINGCTIVKTDIEASNGVIHVIDCVLTPPTP